MKSNGTPFCETLFIFHRERFQYQIQQCNFQSLELRFSSANLRYSSLNRQSQKCSHQQKTWIMGSQLNSCSISNIFTVCDGGGMKNIPNWSFTSFQQNMELHWHQMDLAMVWAIHELVVGNHMSEVKWWLNVNGLSIILCFSEIWYSQAISRQNDLIMSRHPYTI